MFQNILGFFEESFYALSLFLFAFAYANCLVPKRNKYVIRVSISIMLSLLIGGSYYFVLNLLKNYLSYDQIIWTCKGWYCGVLFIIFGLFAFCYKANFTQLIFPFTMGLLVNSIIFGLFRMTYDIGIFELRSITVGAVLTEFIFYLIGFLVVIYLNSIEKKKQRLYLPGKKLSYLMLLIIALVMFIRLSLQSAYEFLYGQQKSWVINMTIAFVPFISLVISIAFVAIDRINEEKNMLNGLLLEKEKQYKMSKKNIDLINQKCHDIKHQLNALKLCDAQNKSKYIDDIYDSIDIYDSTTNTGNVAIDTLLQEKSLYCKSHNIKLTKIIDGNSFDFIDVVDIYTLFGNMVDNAIEASKKIKNKDRRVISLTSSLNSGLLLIRMDNFYEGEIKLSEDNIPLTSKSDKEYHGYGVKSIKYIVDKYQGNMVVKTDNNIFSLVITIPYKQK